MASDFHSEPNKAVVAIGFGIGVIWLAMALWCLVYGIKGYANQRTDYGLAWCVVGVLLLGAALSALIGTWWHQFVLPRRAEQH